MENKTVGTQEKTMTKNTELKKNEKKEVVAKTLVSSNSNTTIYPPLPRQNCVNQEEST